MGRESARVPVQIATESADLSSELKRGLSHIRKHGRAQGRSERISGISVYFGNTTSRATRCRRVVEHCAGEEDAAFADQLTMRSFASKQCQSNLRNYYLRIVQSRVSAQGRLIRQIEIMGLNVSMRIVGRAAA